MTCTSALVAGFLLMGCTNTMTTKIQFTLRAEGANGHDKPFEKPWFGVFAMFLGMSLMNLFHVVNVRLQQGALGKKPQMVTAAAPAGKANGAAVPRRVASVKSQASASASLSPRSKFLAVGLPAALDLVGGGLTNLGLVYISASMWQMLRGSAIVFSAILSVIVLGRRMFGFHWLGVGVCALGIGVVGAADILDSTRGADTSGVSLSGTLFGIAVVTAGQLFSGAQAIAEERLLKRFNLPAALVVGYEGLWGLLLMLLVVFPLLQVLPGSDAGSQENSYDTLVMLGNGRPLRVMVALYIVSCATYNLLAMCVTRVLSAVHRTMFGAIRTLLIWLIGLSTFYLIDPGCPFGEHWDIFSYLQLAGFLVLLLGQAVYTGLIEVPGTMPQPPAIDVASGPSAADLALLNRTTSLRTARSSWQLDRGAPSMWELDYDPGDASPFTVRHMMPELPPDPSSDFGFELLEDDGQD